MACGTTTGPGCSISPANQRTSVYHDTNGTADEHRAAGGRFSAPATITTSHVELGSITSGGSAPPAVRHGGADDATARQLVSAAFSACAKATTITVADCPQSAPTAIGDISNVVWHLTGDPLAGAAVTFDGATGILHVTGDYGMTVDFDLNELVTSHYTRPSYTHRYQADLLWDGQKLVLVSVAGTAG